MEVDLERIIELKLNIEGYLILYSLYNKQEKLLENYCMKIKNKIPTSVFKQLVDEKYLVFKGNGEEYTIDNIELTDKFEEEVLGLEDIKTITFDVAFQQLRECYPKKTPGGRILHQDLDRCKKLYRGVICKMGKALDEELHSLILQCVNFIVNQKKKTNSLDYLQMLPTFLSQRNWETVREEVEGEIRKNGFVEKNDEGGENKTQLGSEDF